MAATHGLAAEDAPRAAAAGGSHEAAQAQSELEANTAELEHAEPTLPVFGDDAKAIYRELAGPLADDDPDMAQPQSSSTATAQVGAEAPTPAETAQPSAVVVDLPEQAEETGPQRDPAPDETVSPATAPEEAVAEQPAGGVEHETVATDAAQVAAAASDNTLNAASEPPPACSEQADNVAPAASAASQETTAAEADTVAARDAPSAVALPAEDTLLDDSTDPAPVAELDTEPEAVQTASAAVGEEAARDANEMTERPAVESDSSNLRAEEQAVAEPAAAADTAGAGEDAATGAASGEAAGDGTAAVEAAAPAEASKVTAAAEDEPPILSLTKDAATGAAFGEDAGADTAATAEAAAPAVVSEVPAAAAEPATLSLGENAVVGAAAADDKDDAVLAAPVIALATGHPSEGTFTDSHGSQAEDEFHDAHDEHSKAVSPAGGSPAASE